MKQAVSAALLFAACLSAPAALGAEFPLRGSAYVQNNWQPNRYEVFCGKYDFALRYRGGQPGTEHDTERNFSCFDASLRDLIARSAMRGLSGIREIGFRPPPVFGPRVETDDGRQAIRMYQTLNQGFASTTYACFPHGSSFRTGGMSTINLNRGMVRWAHRRHMVNYMIVHELMHVVQHGYPVWQEAHCGISAGWIGESAADAIAIHLTREAYPNMFPPTASNREAQQLAGLRRYDYPLNTARTRSTGLLMHYRTSSFWRHVAETYHDGEYGFIHRYFRVRPDNNDWLRWLDNRLRTDPQIRLPLPAVYTGFIADYATWGDRGRPGEFYGRYGWQARAFDGCKTLDLSVEDPDGRLEIGLRRTAARCIRVRVHGVRPGERASVKVAALAGDGPEDAQSGRLTDQLHLGLAGTTDRSRFTCASAVRRQGRRGLSDCVFVPDTGGIRIGEGEIAPARVWSVTTNEAAGRDGQDAGAGVAFTNLYVLTRIAVRPTATPPEDDGGDVMQATLYFVLDVSRLEAGKTGSGPQGGGGGSRQGTQPDGGSGRERTVGTLNLHPTTNAQESLPTYDSSGRPTITRTNPQQFRGFFSPQMNIEDLLRREGVPDGIRSIVFRKVQVTSAGGRQETVTDLEEGLSVTPLEAEGDSYRLRPLRIGDQGTFPAQAGYQSGDRGFINLRTPVTLRVIELTRNVLRAEVSGTLCRVMPPPSGQRCEEPTRISATIVKAFPAAYLPDGRFTVHDTPGTRQYRKIKEDSIGSLDDEAADDSGDGDGGPDGGPGQASGVEARCDCSCEAFHRMRERAQALRDQDPADRDVSGAMRLATCMRQCLMEYSQCSRR